MARRYKQTLIGPDKNNIQKFKTTIYESVPETNDDIFLVTTQGDRLDNLANKFYGDATLWWYIARANNLKTMNLEPGTSIRIPASTEFARSE
jgi:nucleoid-associated protein YgaU